MTTLLGSARRACTGPTRRETLKVGALSLLGGLFHTPALLALEESGGQYLHPARAKSVVLLYLQGGAPTQDMFDLKPLAPADIRGEFKPIATSAQGVEIGELLPQTARWMHRSAIVQRLPQWRLSQELADVYRVRRQPSRRGVPRQRSPQHGLGVCLCRARQAARTARVCLSSLPAGLGRSSQESGTAWRVPRPSL